jgi:hypothetical protein
MRAMTIIRLLVVSTVLLGGTPAFATRVTYPGTHAICDRQQVEFSCQSPFNFESKSTVSDGQAKANAASKTWPGDMILD